MKQFIKRIYLLLEQSGKVRAAAYLARHGYTAESLALMQK